MSRRERGGGPLGWLAIGATVLGLATLAAKWRSPLPAGGIDDPTADQGRGRAATPPSADARRAGHETEDMRGGLMGKLVLLLGAVGVSMVLAMVGLRYWVTQTHLASQAPLTALQTAPITPPLPRLQANPVGELAQLQAAEERRLNAYSYVDGAHTRARIPIGRAMALTVGQGLEPPP